MHKSQGAAHSRASRPRRWSSTLAPRSRSPPPSSPQPSRCVTMENAPPSCSVSSGGAPRNPQAQAGADSQREPDAQLQAQAPAPQEHNMFGGSCAFESSICLRVCIVADPWMVECFAASRQQPQHGHDVPAAAALHAVRDAPALRLLDVKAPRRSSALRPLCSIVVVLSSFQAI
jgi:hypothetical protein